MATRTPSPTKTVGLTKAIRATIDQGELQNVFEAAGAKEITGQATQVLGETTAAHVAPLLAQDRFEAPKGVPEPSTKLVEIAQGAFEPAKLNKALEGAGIDPELGRATVAREMARIAQASTEFADAEERPVCHNCAAVGASRAAAQMASGQP